MTRLALIRHGVTAWNQQNRIQGRTDIALTAAARADVAAWTVPDWLGDAGWFCSPLLRAVQTARLLGAEALAIEPRLIEMNWGEWEGMTFDALRSRDPEGFARAEARGLDLRRPGGESPRDVQARLAPWLAARAAVGHPTIAVTHKGVIRAVMAWALDWDMLGAAPVALHWRHAHLFRLDSAGTPHADRFNVPLSDGSG